MTELPLSPLLKRENFQKLVDSWKGKKLAVCGHLRPDGDCIGSQVAFCRFLLAKGIEAAAIKTDPIPRNLESFVGDTPYIDVKDFDPAGWEMVAVDCADEIRVGKALREKLPTTLFNVDHHISNPGYAEHNLIMAHSCATAEILSELFLSLGHHPDEVTANALYVGIATDTGQFRFPSTSTRTFEICCNLCEFGANPAKVATFLYEQETMGRMQLLQSFLSTLKLSLDGKVCTGCILDGEYERTGTSNEDSEGFVDYARAIEGVRVGVFLEENKGKIKGSLRCKDPIFRVDTIAKQFDGGGHACAAGFRVESTIEEFYPKLVRILEDHLQNSQVAG
ncbi:DHH family phosphoesterase [Puniceicoccus vermicola]|uniref:Bifunctional oligoribonuclease/PAP phosphatase NrnA n=1 Tax=Puniceicoccus vermicola TaxID=388746 RepID=A0A7X1AYP2_9BACT|nr:bifunctional oligoribonuclease/PAP phosphatase NrnA [Puniceicoccus vermicola]MBC2602342.1 bifunctional oligoribonuclease/PAP phosphatase NrnA [Puniceicoccus vermicola]